MKLCGSSLTFHQIINPELWNGNIDIPPGKVEEGVFFLLYYFNEIERTHAPKILNLVQIQFSKHT